MGTAVRNVTSLKAIDGQPLTVIIPAAGEGLRMKSYGPKSLIKLNNHLTLLEYQVKLIRKQFENPTIIVVAGHEFQRVMSHSPSDIIYIENERHATTNVVKSIGLGLRATLTNRVLILYGDLICNTAALKVSLNNESLVFIDTSDTMTENEVGCIINNNYVEHMLYDLPNKWAQIVYLTGKELALFRELAEHPEYERWYGFEALNHIIANNGKLKAVKPKNIKANDIDTSKDLSIAHESIIN